MRKLWDQDYKSVYLNYLYKSDSKEEKDAQVIKLVSKLWALLEAQGEIMIKRSWVFIPGAGLQHSCRAHCLGAKTRKVMVRFPPSAGDFSSSYISWSLVFCSNSEFSNYISVWIIFYLICFLSISTVKYYLRVSWNLFDNISMDSSSLSIF